MAALYYGQSLDGSTIYFNQQMAAQCYFNQQMAAQYYLFIYLFINQSLLSATYTMTSGQLYIVYSCSNLNEISLSNAMICRIEQKSFQFLFEKLGVRDQSNVNG